MSKEKRVTVLLDEETKQKWERFKEEHNYQTISEFVRQSVNFCIEEANLVSVMKDFKNFSHALKEPLTTIKLSSQILMKNYADQLDSKIVDILKRINIQTETLENEINSVLEGSGLESSEGKYDILIVEDDSEFLDVLQILFDIKGFKIKAVNSGNKGLEWLKHHKPKLILLDILLPDVDGYEVCKEIRKREELKEIPIYYMTAVPEREVNKRMEETHADGYFLKPLDDDFADEVAQILSKKRE